MRGPSRAPHSLEPLQGRIDDGAHRPVVAQRRNASDREPGCVAHLVAVRLTGARPELGRIDPPIAGAEAKHRPGFVHEDEGLDDLTHLDAHGGRSLLGRPGRVRQFLHLGIEAELAESVLESLGSWVEHGSDLGY